MDPLNACGSKIEYVLGDTAALHWWPLFPETALYNNSSFTGEDWTNMGGLNITSIHTSKSIYFHFTAPIKLR